MGREQFPCKWGNCDKHFEVVEDLFNHLTDEHVGRKATNNLCLECHWENCRTVAAKRDHLASHLRVHLPLKPHHCQLCKKGFKRPQDLKKHERIHTIEHQASLLSNQPGYKPQRRRRKPAQSTPSNRGTSEASELSSCSPNFAYMSSPEHEENPKLFQDPLQGFINDILMDQTQPSYNTEMMNRLNSIAPALQYQANWSLPCVPESVPTLQNWLEQLSSNIQTEDNIYPSITINGSNNNDNNNNNGNLATVDYDLYPKLDDNNEWTTPSYTTQSEKTDDSPTTPPMSQTTSSPMPKEDEMKSPNFWTPGFVAASVNEPYRSEDMVTDGPFPSEPIDFTTMIRPSSHVEPNSVFETTKQELDPIKPNLDSSVSFTEKQTLVEMINQFKSPYDCLPSDTNELTQKPINKDKQLAAENNVSDTNISHVDKAKVEESEQKEEQEEEEGEEEEEEDEDEDEESSSDEDYYGYPELETKGDKSPYNELLDSIENMQLEDEETTRKRHLKLIDHLYQLLSKAS